MSARDDHVRQWLHNRTFLTTIPPQYNDWIVTVTFYTALHAVDALLVHDRVAVYNHASRNRTIASINRYDRIDRGYTPLYYLSRTARYVADPNQWIPADRIPKEVIQRHLYPIEASVQKLVGHDLKLG